MPAEAALVRFMNRIPTPRRYSDRELELMQKELDTVGLFMCLFHLGAVINIFIA